MGRLRETAERQNEIFLKYVQTGVPFVHLKLATSLDGRLATRNGDARWISGQAAQALVHRMRRRHAAILVGIGTVLADDPQLTVRHVVGRQPVPVVLDAHGRIPLTARLLACDRHPIVAAAQVRAEGRAELESVGCRVWELPGERTGKIDLARLLARLGEAGIDSVLVEGGGETAASFLEAGLVDRVSFFIAPMIIGGRSAVPAVAGAGAARLLDAIRLTDVTTTWVGPDLLYSALVRRGDAPRAPRT